MKKFKAGSKLKGIAVDVAPDGKVTPKKKRYDVCTELKRAKNPPQKYRGKKPVDDFRV